MYNFHGYTLRQPSFAKLIPVKDAHELNPPYVFGDRIKDNIYNSQNKEKLMKFITKHVTDFSTK